MGVFPVRRVRTRQPSNIALPCEGLRFSAIGTAINSFHVDAVCGKVADVSGTIRTTSHGVGVISPRGTITIGNSDNSTGYTLIAIVSGNASVQANWLGADAQTRYFQFRASVHGGSSVEFIAFDSFGSPSFAYASVSGVPQTENTFHVVIGTVGQGIAQAWSAPIGGTPLSNGSVVVTSPKMLDSAQSIFIGSRFGVESNPFYGTMLGYAVLLESINNQQAIGICQNPWQIFEPEKRLLFNFSGSSGAYTLTASGGTYTVQGASAGIFRSRVLSGTGGSYTLTGGQAVVSRNRKLVASGGIYNYTGQSITITHTGTSNAYTLTAQGGSYALSGGIARILKSKRITSVGGVYTLTGSDAVVLKSKYLTAASGTYSLTGGTATVLKSKVLISTGGVYSYTGSSTVIKKSKYLSALGGSYSLLGSSVVLVHGGIGGIVWPPTHLVVLGTVYGPTGSEYTGTLDVNGIKYDITTGQLVKPISDKVVMSL